MVGKVRAQRVEDILIKFRKMQEGYGVLDQFVGHLLEDNNETGGEEYQWMRDYLDVVDKYREDCESLIENEDQVSELEFVMQLMGISMNFDKKHRAMKTALLEHPDSVIRVPIQLLE